MKMMKKKKKKMKMNYFTPESQGDLQLYFNKQKGIKNKLTNRLLGKLPLFHIRNSKALSITLITRRIVKIKFHKNISTALSHKHPLSQKQFI